MHEHRHLLTVGGGLESGADSYLRLSKTDVAAYEPVHRPVELHIGLYGLYGTELVGGILVDEACLQLMLQI